MITRARALLARSPAVASPSFTNSPPPSALASAIPPPTPVTAGARIGHALRRLTTTGSQQVLCVTHLPQVAACGDTHLIVSKSPDDDADGRTTIDIRRIDSRDSRVEEISQMLGIGDVEGRESANRLVDEAVAAFS